LCQTLFHLFFESILCIGHDQGITSTIANVANSNSKQTTASSSVVYIV